MRAARGLFQPGGGGTSSSLTVEEADGAPSIANVTTLRFDQGDGFVVTDIGGGVARVDVTATPAPDLNAQIFAWVIGAA